jgi:Protein of unknown function (DUF3027)
VTTPDAPEATEPATGEPTSESTPRQAASGSAPGEAATGESASGDVSSTPPQTSRGTDTTLAAAVDVARAAALEVGGDSVGEHLDFRLEDERIGTHSFVASLPGYVGWYWAVTVTRLSRSRTVTVDEVVLLPGEGALLAPAWVPWEERVQPGDLSPGDLVPPPGADDPRLVPGYVLSDDPAVEEVAFELGLGRERVMSREGRLWAAERWHDGPHGPDTAMARQAPAHCGTCGFYLPVAGSLRGGFGVCGNEITESDGQVVSVEYGCGAHSQVTVEPAPLADVAELVYDDGEEFTD